MAPLRRVRGIAVPFGRPNVDTDQIIPGRFIMKRRDYDYASLLFHDLRFGPRAEVDFPLDAPVYRGARILVTAPNFGCGSAREQAVWAIHEFGIQVLVGPSFGGIFRVNCVKNGVLPAIVPEAAAQALCVALQTRPGSEMEVDLERRTVTGPAGESIPFEIGESDRAQLLSGKDDITRTLEHQAQIDAWEQAYNAAAVWRRPLAGEAIARTRRVPIRSGAK